MPVFLTCSKESLEQRVGAADRLAKRKVTTKEGLVSHFELTNA